MLTMYVKDTQPQYLSCVQQCILLKNYHRFPPPPKKYVRIS